MMSLWIVLVVCVLKCSAMSRNELDEFSDYLFQTSQLDLNVKKGGDPDADFFDEDEQASDHAWEESGKFEGDLILNDRQRRLIVENVEGLSRNGLTDSSKRWPDNEVIYFIQREHFNSAQIESIERGIEDLAQASCVKFRPYRKGDRDAVVIQGSRRGCFSNVGYQGGFQVLNLSGRHPAGRGCFRHGTVIHEMLHTLGFFHMQSSPDRDDYINVLWENILQSTRHNFRKYNSFSVSDFGVGYDYDSVLHYSRRAFSSNGKDTLVPKQRGVSIGQRIGLSDKDTLKLNKMYCDADSNNFEADENQKPKKKKKPKNVPFDGHGIGYHQGKTVVIKLPTSENIKLPEVSPIDTFDYYSNAPQSVSSQDAGVSVYGEDVSYPYRTSTLLNMMRENPNMNKEQAERNKAIAQWANPRYTNHDAHADEKEESLAEMYKRLDKTIKQKVYPESRDYTFKINKDYSQFFTPAEYKSSDAIKNLDERFGTTNKVPPHILARKPIRITQEKKLPAGYENTDSSYRTAFPTRIPYSTFERTETPKYATREYLRDRQNFDHLYSARNVEQLHDHPANKDEESSSNEDSWYRKDSSRPSSAKYPLSYTDYVTMEHKSNDASQRPNSDEDDDDRRDIKKSEENVSGDYSDESSEPPQKNQAYSLFGTQVPLSDSWYKPVYLNLEEMPHSYSEESQEDS